MKRARLVSGAILAAALASTSAARANGRYPESNQVVFSESDPDLVIVRVTFGILVSHDRGQTFQWVCEASIGYSGVEDPMYATTPSNAIIGTTFQGLSITRDNACNWAAAGGDLSGQVFIDLSSNPNDQKNIVVFASAYDKQNDAGDILFSSKIWETKDEAQTFAQLGTPLDPTLLGYTIDRTKTDPDRLYVTAVRDPGASPKGVLLVSKNHGQTWDEEPIQLVDQVEHAVYIAAVDPTNAERVYLRTSGGVDKPTRLILREAVDGGPPTQRTVFTATGPLQGFAISPDGGKVYVGGPKDGIQVASTTDFDFTSRSTIQTQCLALHGDDLWACSNESQGFVAGVSKDEGATFEPRLRFCQISGPIASCGPGTATNDRCQPNWPPQKALLGCSGADDGGTPDDLADGGTRAESLPPPKKSCDCHAAPAGPWGAFISVVGAAVALLRRARRRER